MLACMEPSGFGLYWIGSRSLTHILILKHEKEEWLIKAIVLQKIRENAYFFWEVGYEEDNCSVFYPVYNWHLYKR